MVCRNRKRLEQEWHSKKKKWPVHCTSGGQVSSLQLHVWTRSVVVKVLVVLVTESYARLLWGGRVSVLGLSSEMA